MTRAQSMTISSALAALAEQHRRTFPWYADLLRARGCTRPTRLADLPIIDEQLLNEHYYDADHPHLEDAAVYRTSGTVSRRRKAIRYSPLDEDDYVAQRGALFREFLAEVPQGAVAVSDLGTGHAAASARRIFREMRLQAHDIDVTAPLDEHISQLNAYQPDVLFTMPMILDRLQNASRPLTIAPRKIMVLGDVAPATWRRNVADRFGISAADVLDVVGSIEVGAIAYHRADTGLYHFHDHIVPEAHRPEDLYADCPHRLGNAGPGDGILVLTSFARRYFPALRFATNDVVSGLRQMKHQGRTVHVFDRIEGRFGGEVKHGERISSHDLVTAVHRACPGALFDVQDTETLTIRVAVDALTEGQVQTIKQSLRESSPDVARMIDSGLVGDIVVQRVAASALTATSAKRSFTVKVT